jgi:hypothetical protein
MPETGQRQLFFWHAEVLRHSCERMTALVMVGLHCIFARYWPKANIPARRRSLVRVAILLQDSENRPTRFRAFP